MADFDPDAYLAQYPKGPESFDPDAYLAQFPSGPHVSAGEDVARSVVPSLERGPMNFLGMPEASGSMVDRAANWVKDKTGVDPTAAIPMLAVTRLGKYLPSTETIEKAAEPITGKLYQPKTPQGRIVGSTLESVTNPASYIGGGGLVQNLGRAALSGAGAGVGEEVAGTPGAIIGGLAGGLAPSALPRIAGRAMTSPYAGKIAPDHQADVDILRSEGIEPTAADVIGSESLKTLQSQMGTLPGSGDAAVRESRRALGEFTQAASRRMGENLTNIKPADMTRVRDRLQNTFESATKDLEIKRDKQFGNDVGDWFEDLFTEGVDKPTLDRLSQQLRNVLRGFDPLNKGKNLMKGDAYMALTRKNTQLDRAMNDPNPTVSFYATRLRSILDDTVQRNVDDAVKNAYSRGQPQGPAQARAIKLATAQENLKEARSQWYAHMLLSKAISGPGEGAAKGYVTPQKLRQVLTSGEDNKIKYARETGRLDNIDALSRAGESVMSPIPTSKTAERLMSAAGIGGLASAVGATLFGAPAAIPAWTLGAFGPGMTGRAMLSRTGQNWLKNQTPSRLLQGPAPQYLEQAARSVGGNPFLAGATNPYAP